MTPKQSNELNYVESTPRYQHHSLPQARHQYEPNDRKSPQLQEFCTLRRKNSLSTSKCFKRQTDHSRKTNLSPENKRIHNNHLYQHFKKRSRTSAGTVKCYLTNEHPIPASLHINLIIETNLSLLMENTFPDETLLNMTNMTVKIQIKGTTLTPDLLLQFVTTINGFLVLL